MSSFERDDRLRERIKRGFTEKDPRCLLELAGCAVDEKYSGFEDPKVAAQEAIDGLRPPTWFKVPRDEVACERECGTVVKIRGQFDGYIVKKGECGIGAVCLSELWTDVRDGETEYSEVMETGISFAGANNAGQYCPHLGCSFSCGVSIDGNAGTAGVCMNEPVETVDQV
jgi:hypothetical protein